MLKGRTAVAKLPEQKKRALPDRTSAPRIVRDALQSAGRPLPATTRAKMEKRFRFSFSQVSLHEGDLAKRSAASLDALAYTVGNHVVLGPAANTDVLAHELAHVAQNGGQPLPDLDRLQIAPEGGLAEIQADGAATAVARESSVAPLSVVPAGYVRRKVARDKKAPAEPVAAPAALTDEEKDVLDQRKIVPDTVTQIFQERTAKPITYVPDVRDEVVQLFESRYGKSLVYWLIEYSKTRKDLIFSLANVESGLSTPPQALIASATLGKSVLEDPAAILTRIARDNGKTAKTVEEAYNHTYPKVLAESRGLQRDLLVFYGDYKSFLAPAATLDHPLTDAEQLYLYGVGENSVQLDPAVKLLHQVWLRGTVSALREVEKDWTRYVQNQAHWSKLVPSWSALNFVEALEKSFSWRGDRRRIYPYLLALGRVDGPIEEDKPGEWTQLEREMERLTTPFLQTLESAILWHGNDHDQAQEALRNLHQAWQNAIEKATGPKRQHLKESYTAQIRFVQKTFFSHFEEDKTVAPFFLESPTLSDELYALLYPGWGSRQTGSAFAFKEFDAIEGVLLRSWAEGGGRIDALIDDAYHEKKVLDVVVRPRFVLVSKIWDFHLFPRTARTISDMTRKRIYALIETNDTNDNVLRGFNCLQVELRPSMDVPDVIKPRNNEYFQLSDPELNGVYKLLTTAGLSKELRNKVIARYLENTVAGNRQFRVEDNGTRNDARTFLAFLTYLTDERGDNYYKFQTLLDPTLDSNERATRMELHRDAGSNWFTRGLTDFADEVRGLDSRGAVNATIESVRDRKRASQARRQIELYGAKDLEALAGLQDKEFETRVTALHASEEMINGMVLKVVEWMAEGALCAALGPLWWGQLAAAVGSKLIGMAGHEVLSGSRFTLQNRENLKELINAALGALLVDPVDFRGRISNVFHPEKLRFMTAWEPGNAKFAGEVMLNAVAGGAEAVAKILPGIALDVFMLNQDLDGNALSAAAHTLFADVFGKAALPFLGSMDINPQAIHDLTSPGDNLKINILFKMMLAVPSVLKKVADDPAADLNTVLTAIGQKMTGAMFKGGGSSAGRLLYAKKNKAQVAAVYGKEGALTEEGLRIIGRAALADPERRAALIGEGAVGIVSVRALPKQALTNVQYVIPELGKNAPGKIANPGQMSIVVWPGEAVSKYSAGRDFAHPERWAIRNAKTEADRELLAGKAEVKAAEGNIKLQLKQHKALLDNVQGMYGDVAASVFGGNQAIPFTRADAAERVAQQMSKGALRARYRKDVVANPNLTPLTWAEKMQASDPAFKKTFQDSADSVRKEENVRRGLGLFE